MPKPKLKIGVLIDDFVAPAWMCKTIEVIKKSEYAEVTLLIKNLSQSSKISVFRKLVLQYNHVFYQGYRKIENLLFKPGPNAFKAQDLRDALPPSIPVLEIIPVQKKFSDYIKKEDIDKIKEYDVDILIRFGFRILRGDILTSARYGIWSFHHGDNLVNRGGPAGAWEVIQKNELTGSILQILKDDLDGGTVLYRSWSSTYKHFINHNLNYYYWKTLSFLPRCLEKLHRLGAEAFFKDVEEENKHPVFYSHRIFVKPKNIEFLKFLATHSWKLASYSLWRLFNVEQWILMYSINSVEQPSYSLFKYQKMVPPKGKFWADPFVVSANDKYYIFLEEYLYKTRKGHISLIEMDGKGNYSEAKVILDKGYHLSYPFIFEWQDSYYMIPESRQNKTIELYKCTGFPDKWEFVMNLMEDVNAVDATIHFKDNKFWLFVNICEWEGSPAGDELFLFYSEKFPSKEWKQHPKSPVVSDVRSARPAGRLFEHNGSLYRPSQDGSHSYGYATNINHVLELTETDYKEQKVSSIQPHWNKKIRCTHSLSFSGKLTVVDALLRRSKFY